MTTPAPPINVAVIAFDGITPFHLSVPCLVFDATRDGEEGGFNVRVCAADGTPLRTSAGFAIATDFDLRALDEADIVIMPSWHNDCRAAPRRCWTPCAPPMRAARGWWDCAWARFRWPKPACWTG